MAEGAVMKTISDYRISLSESRITGERAFLKTENTFLYMDFSKIQW